MKKSTVDSRQSKVEARRRIDPLPNLVGRLSTDDCELWTEVYMPIRRRVQALLVVAVLVLAACSSGPETPLTSLAQGTEPLRSAFNRDAGKVRLLLLLDPT